MYFDFAQYYKQKGFTAKQEAGFIPILIAILVAVLVGGYFVYSKSQTKTPPAQPTTSSTPQPSRNPSETNSVTSFAH